MSLDQLSASMLPAIEARLEKALAPINLPLYRDLHGMMTYHLGMQEEGAGQEARGKRIRPLLVTLTTAAAGGDWHSALPAAAAVELVHNFSLIHDDIEDNSPTRRGRPTVWRKWGIPQAINTGDAMFTLAHLAIFDLQGSFPAEIVQQAAHLLQETCLQLTEGQYLDLSFVGLREMELDEYWPMVSGKTAALIAGCTKLGAILAHGDPSLQRAYHQFGYNLGLAFQVKDDLLGIWGDIKQTGKSNQSDLLEGKKTLPVLYGLRQRGRFSETWLKGNLQPEDVPLMADQLANEGALAYAQQKADELTQLALQSLEQARPAGEAAKALVELTTMLLKRKI